MVTPHAVADASYNRHVRYCASRKRTRPQSCQACSIAKVKCSFALPCSRCTKKNIPCIYGAVLVPESPNTHPDTPISVSDAETRPPKSQTSDSSLLSIPMNPNNDWLFDFDDHISAPDQWPTDVYVSTANAVDQPSSSELAAWCHWAMRSESFLAVAGIATVGGSAVQTAHQGSFVLLVVQSLRAIPNMMLRRETFPWFIHAHNVRHQSITNESNITLAAELVTCMSVAQLFALRTSDTHGSLWQMVRIELDRLSSQVCFSSLIRLQHHDLGLS